MSAVDELKGMFAEYAAKPAARSVAAGLAGLLVFAVVYVPLDRRERAAAASLADIRKQITDVRASGLPSLRGEEITRLETSAKRFDAGFIRLSQAPAVLDDISGRAEKNGVSVISLDSRDPAELLDPSGQPLVWQGGRVRRLPIHMRLRGPYASIGEFFRGLETPPAPLFSVEKLSMRRLADSAGHVECELDLDFFSKE